MAVGRELNAGLGDGGQEKGAEYLPRGRVQAAEQPVLLPAVELLTVGAEGHLPEIRPEVSRAETGQRTLGQWVAIQVGVCDFGCLGWPLRPFTGLGFRVCRGDTNQAEAGEWKQETPGPGHEQPLRRSGCG